MHCVHRPRQPSTLCGALQGGHFPPAFCVHGARRLSAWTARASTASPHSPCPRPAPPPAAVAGRLASQCPACGFFSALPEGSAVVRTQGLAPRKVKQTRKPPRVSQRGLLCRDASAGLPPARAAARPCCAPRVAAQGSAPSARGRMQGILGHAGRGPTGSQKWLRVRPAPDKSLEVAPSLGIWTRPAADTPVQASRLTSRAARPGGLWVRPTLRKGLVGRGWG